MRTAHRYVILAAFCAAAFAAAPVTAEDKTPQPTPKPAARPAPKPVASAAVPVPADVRARVVAKLQGASPADVAASPIPGLYEVTMGGLIAYVSSDGNFLVSGNIYDLDSQTNLTAARRNAARAKTLASLRDDQMIVFSPDKPKMTVTVFTDVDCGYCQRFHSHIVEMNKAGVRVRYMLYPRTGPGTESWRKAEAVWCSADRKDALTRAKRGQDVKSKDCGDAAIQTQYTMGEDLGVEGTPAVFTQTGDYIGGYMSPEQLVLAVQESQKAAAVAR